MPVAQEVNGVKWLGNGGGREGVGSKVNQEVIPAFTSLTQRHSRDGFSVRSSFLRPSFLDEHDPARLGFSRNVRREKNAWRMIKDETAISEFCDFVCVSFVLIFNDAGTGWSCRTVRRRRDPAGRQPGGREPSTHSRCYCGKVVSIRRSPCGRSCGLGPGPA